MSDALPATAQQRLQQTLAQWRQWRCDPAPARAPRVLHPLGGGHGNHTVLVEAGAFYAVRIAGAGGAAAGVDRRAEARALEDAAAAGLAPQPRYVNPDLGTLVCDYLPPDARGGESPAGVAALLRAIHALPPRHRRLDLAQHILRHEHYLRQRGRPLPPALAALRPALQALLRSVQRDTSARVACHHDLLRANRLWSGGRLYALDWEYCAMGSPWYDLAVVIHGDDLSRDAGESLAAHYLGRAPAPHEQALVYRYGMLYRYLELLWYLTLPAPLATVDLAARQARLANLLLRHDH